MMLAILLAVAGSAGSVKAAPNPTTCTNDIDCAANLACGGDVCEWPDMKCVPASASVKGWCDPSHGDNDCKCKADGAKCEGVYCTVIMKATGTAGTGGGAAGAGAAGATGAAGTTGAAGSGTSGGGGGGGCAVASGAAGGLSALAGLALVVGGLARRRRR